MRMVPAPFRRPVSKAVAWLGKRLGIDAGYAVRNTVIATLTYGATVLSGLVTGYLVARFFPPELYGKYKFVVTIVGAVGLISLPGLGSALSRTLIHRKDKTPLRWTLKMNVLLCLAGALVLLAAIPLLPLWNREDLWPLFVIAAVLFVPNQVGSTFFSAVVTGTESFGRSLRVTALGSALVIPSVLLMLWLRPSPVLLMAFGVGIPATLYLREVAKAWRRFPSEEKSNEVIRYGTQLSLNTIPISLSSYLDALLVSAFFGLNTLAVFSVAILIPEQAKTWSKYLLPVGFAKQAAGDDTRERRRKMARLIGGATVLFAMGVAVYVLVAPWLLPLLFPKYLGQMGDIVLYTRLSSLILLTAPAVLFPQYLEARGMVKELRSCQWGSAAVFCLTLVALVPTLGPVGALIARGMFRLTYVGYAWWILRHSPPARTGI